jgi:hypothetical protein
MIGVYNQQEKPGSIWWITLDPFLVSSLSSFLVRATRLGGTVGTLSGGEGAALGGKGKGILLYILTDVAGTPLASRPTPAHGNARARVRPPLEVVRWRTGKRGRPRNRPKVIATDQGYDAKDLRRQLRTRGSRAQIPKRLWKAKKARDRPLKVDLPQFQAEGTFAWFQKKYRRLAVR